MSPTLPQQGEPPQEAEDDIGLLPTGRSEAERRRRAEFFARLDANGNGYISLAEVDLGLRIYFDEAGVANPKSVVDLAFATAREAVEPVHEFGGAYVDKRHFRLMLVYVEYYLGLWAEFGIMDASGDKRIDEAEFQRALPTLQQLGVPDAEAWQADPAAAFNSMDADGGGVIRFEEFAQYCLRGSLHGLHDERDRREALEALQRRRPKERPWSASGRMRVSGAQKKGGPCRHGQGFSRSMGYEVCLLCGHGRLQAASNPFTWEAPPARRFDPGAPRRHGGRTWETLCPEVLRAAQSRGPGPSSPPRAVAKARSLRALSGTRRRRLPAWAIHGTGIDERGDQMMDHSAKAVATA